MSLSRLPRFFAFRPDLVKPRAMELHWSMESAEAAHQS